MILSEEQEENFNMTTLNISQKTINLLQKLEDELRLALIASEKLLEELKEVTIIEEA